MTNPKPSEGERLERHLKNEARLLLKSAKAGDAEALFRVSAYFKEPEQVTLQQVQLVVAREHGCDSWNKLKAQAHTPRQPTALNRDLQQALESGYSAATEGRHQSFTVEHALLALLGIAAVNDVLTNLGCDVALLHRELAAFIENDTARLSADCEHKTEPAPGFQRVMQSAVFHMQFTEKGVSATNVLGAIFAERESKAVALLNEQNITMMSVVNYLRSDD